MEDEGVDWSVMRSKWERSQKVGPDWIYIGFSGHKASNLIERNTKYCPGSCFSIGPHNINSSQFFPIMEGIEHSRGG
jgi:hypothetical protein